MNPTDLALMSAVEQARLVRSQGVTPLDLVQVYLDRIQQLDGQLGSYVVVAAEQAIADAQAKTDQLLTTPAEELPPLFGVPISIKDLNPVAGLPCAYGVRWSKGRMATTDDGVVQRIKAAGCVILGKTATSEAGILPFTEPDGFPPTRNPWNLAYTPGGSSGGAAAALAAGLCAIAQGSDGGGSVRGPAFCCGLVGIKPSRGRISYAPLGERLGGIATNGPIARTVEDAAALLDIMAGYELGDPYWLATPEPSFQAVAQRGEPGKLRIGFTTAIAPVGEAQGACRTAVLETAQRLEALGHTVFPVDLMDLTELIEPFTIVFQSILNEAGIPEIFLGKMNRWFALRARFCSCGQYLRSLSKLQVIARQLVQQFQTMDVLLLPTYMHPTIRLKEWARYRPAKTLEKIIDWIAPCPPFNASGQPAIALPTGLDSTGLPVGVQLVGQPAGEATLIALAAQFEQAHPWTQRPDFATQL